jgi:hypothetical protein
MHERLASRTDRSLNHKRQTQTERVSIWRYQKSGDFRTTNQFAQLSRVPQTAERTVLYTEWMRVVSACSW